MNTKQEKSLVKKATEEILREKGIDYNEWKQDIIDKKKLEIMTDKDKSWTDATINDASLKLILKNMKSRTLSSSTSNH